MQKSITTRYFTTTAVILLCSVILLGAIFFSFAMQYFEAENVGKLESAAFMISEIIEQIEKNDKPEEMPFDVHPQDLEKWASQFIWQAGLLADAKVFVTDEKGIIINCNDGASSGLIGQQAPLKLIKQAEKNRTSSELGTLGGIYKTNYYTAVRSFYGPYGIIKGFVFASSDATNLTTYLKNVFSAFFIASGIMMLISSVVSIVLTNRVTTPLRRISEVATSFGKGDFTARVVVTGDDEVSQLALTFNNMASSLEEMDQNRQSFMGNIAHELRTPMTTIKGFIDGMIDGVIPQEKYDYYLKIVSEESGRLTRLIKNMLDLSKLQAGEYVLNPECYDVWDTITSALFGAEKRLQDKHIGVLGFHPNKTFVMADKDIVYQVFYNILDNAVKFTNDGGTITVDVTSDEHFVKISLENTGMGISK